MIIFVNPDPIQAFLLLFNDKSKTEEEQNKGTRGILKLKSKSPHKKTSDASSHRGNYFFVTAPFLFFRSIVDVTSVSLVFFSFDLRQYE